jgi:predicted DNA-binding transcriptional regulator YafY
MTQTERFGIIERLLRSRRTVGFADLRDRLGVSRATLFRDLRDLRERMRVPIILDHATGNYRIDCSVERYELPGIWFSAGEIHALLSMQQLLAAFDPAGILAEHISPLRERLASMLETGQSSAEDIVHRIRILSVAARHFAPQHFPTIATALMERRRLGIEYRARSNGTTSQREISPQRLTHYRDNWYLDAWCHLRDELRSFAVDARRAAKRSHIICFPIIAWMLRRLPTSFVGRHPSFRQHLMAVTGIDTAGTAILVWLGVLGGIT